MATGFNFGSNANASSSGQTGLGGFSFGNTNKPVGTATPLTASGASAVTTTSAPASTGFSFGNTSASTSLNLGVVKPLPTTTAPLTLGGFGASSTSSSTFGSTATGTTSLGGGFSLGGGLGGTSLGLGSGDAKPPTITSGTSTLGSFSLGATLSTLSAPNVGLGGVDPKDSGSGTSSLTGDASKSRDVKATKEVQVPSEICQTVEDFKKHVKTQKQEYEKISRMSSKNLFRVQEEVSSLKQLLAIVSNGLQRNAVAINNLKSQSAQELKYAEIAQRTKDTPDGLQYENTAPAEYFQNLMIDFEQRMITYRHQIEQTETFISSMNQETALTPKELSALMAKLHSSFVSLAAHLQAVHEAVKVQKEHYLNYRKVFHGDSTDIFERKRKVEEKTGCRIVATTTVGPTPFTGMSSAAAMAMAAAVHRTPQQPQAQGGVGGLPTLGQTGLNTGGFGSNNTSFNTGTGATGLFSANKSGFGLPAASTNVSSLFGSSLTTQSSGFGNTSFGAPGSTSLGFGQSTNNNSFQLQKPPLGNKRNKNM